jgi:hypothetical protein
METAPSYAATFQASSSQENKKAQPISAGLNAPLRSFNISPYLAFYTVKDELSRACG